MKRYYRRFKRGLLIQLVKERTKAHLRDAKEARDVCERTIHFRKAKAYNDVNILIETDYTFQGQRYETN